MGAQLAVVPEFGPFDALADEAFLAYQIGDRSHAAILCHRSLVVTRAAGDDASTRYLLYTLVRADTELRRIDEALAALEELDELCRDDVQPYWRAKAAVVRALAVRRSDDPVEVVEQLALGWLLTGRPDGRSYSQLSAAVVLAEGLRTLELFEQAEELLEAVARVSPNLTTTRGIVVESVRTLAAWGMWLFVVGRQEESLEVALRLASCALRLERLDPQRRHAPLVLAAGALAAALVGDAEPALTTARRARLDPGLQPDRPEWLMAVAAQALAHAQLGAAAEANLLAVVLRSGALQTDRTVWERAGQMMQLELGLADADEPLALAAQLVRRVVQELWAERTARFESVRSLVRVHELEAENRRVREAGRTDALTGVGNRRALEEQLADREGRVVALFADVDRFKEVNDRFSHTVGDQVLLAVAGVLVQESGPDLQVTRFGGDEFVVLAAPHQGTAQMEQLADRIAASLRGQRWARLADDLHLTLSFGIAEADSPGALLEEVSRAVLAAKRAGRDRRVTTGDSRSGSERRSGAASAVVDDDRHEHEDRRSGAQRRSGLERRHRGALATVPVYGPFQRLVEELFARYEDGALEDSVQRGAELLALTRAAGDERTTRYVLYVVSGVLLDLNRLDEADARLDDLDALCSADVVPFWRAKAAAMRGLVDHRRGLHQQALARLALAWVLTTGPETDDPNQVSAIVLLAEGLRTVELFEDADRLLRRAFVGSTGSLRVALAYELVCNGVEWTVRLRLVGLEANARAVVLNLASQARLLSRVDEEGRHKDAALAVDLLAADVLKDHAAVAIMVGLMPQQVGPRPERLENLAVLAVRIRELVRQGRWAQARDDLRRLREGAAGQPREVWSLAADSLAVTCAPRHDEADPLLSLALTMADDIGRELWTERRERFENLLALARIHELEVAMADARSAGLVDPLTGVANRRALDEELAARSGPLAGIFVDIDRFKDVNELRSHVVGDDVLRRLALVLQDAGAGMFVARFGGDEFVLLPAPGSTVDEDGLRRVARAAAGSFAAQRWDELARGLRVTASFGVAAAPSPDALLSALSHAMLAAKRARRRTS